MATTHSQITQVDPSQSDKVTTINAAIEQLDNLLNDELDVTVTADFLLSDAQQDNSFSYHLTGSPSAFTMALNARQKFFAVRNDTGVTATIECDPDEDGADGRTVDVADGEFLLLYCDGTNIDSLGSASGGGSTVIDWKESVRVATTAAGTLASDFENGDTIDDITLATDDRILLQDQADASENGYYVVQASGAPVRAEDFDSTEEVTAGAICYVEEGTTNGGKLFILTTTGAVTIDTTDLTFAEFSGGGGASAFTDLTDAPSSYTGQAGKLVAVKDTEDGVEFIDAATPDSNALAFVVAAGDETTAVTTGTGLVTFRAPYGFTIAEVRASLTTASTSGAVTVDINKGGSSILSTKLTIDQDEKTSTTAATPAVISDTSVSDDDEFTIDVDGAGSGAAGLKVTIITTAIGSGGSGGGGADSVLSSGYNIEDFTSFSDAGDNLSLDFDGTDSPTFGGWTLEDFISGTVSLYNDSGDMSDAIYDLTTRPGTLLLQMSGDETGNASHGLRVTDTLDDGESLVVKWIVPHTYGGSSSALRFGIGQNDLTTVINPSSANNTGMEYYSPAVSSSDAAHIEAAGGNGDGDVSPGLPIYMRMSRVGSTLYFLWSQDGKTWSVQGQATVDVDWDNMWVFARVDGAGPDGQAVFGIEWIKHVASTALDLW